MERQIRPNFGQTPLVKLRTSDVQAWVGRLEASGLAASSVGTYFRVLAQAMRSAKRDRLIHESPCDGVRLRRADRAASSLSVLMGEQVAALADEVPDRYVALVLTSAGSGSVRARRAPSRSIAWTSPAAR